MVARIVPFPEDIADDATVDLILRYIAQTTTCMVHCRSPISAVSGDGSTHLRCTAYGREEIRAYVSWGQPSRPAFLHVDCHTNFPLNQDGWEEKLDRVVRNANDVRIARLLRAEDVFVLTFGQKSLGIRGDRVVAVVRVLHTNGAIKLAGDCLYAHSDLPRVYRYSHATALTPAARHSLIHDQDVPAFPRGVPDVAIRLRTLRTTLSLEGPERALSLHRIMVFLEKSPFGDLCTIGNLDEIGVRFLTRDEHGVFELVITGLVMSAHAGYLSGL